MKRKINLKKIAKYILTLMLIILTILATLSFISNGSYGVQDQNTTTKYLSLYSGTGNESQSRNGRPTGFYTSGVSNGGGKIAGGNTIPIIKIVEVSKAGESGTPKHGEEEEVIYCLNNGVGFGQGQGESEAKDGLEYVNNYDMRNAEDIEENFKSYVSYNTENLDSNINYNELMWLLDNICIPEDDESVNELFEKADLEETKADLETKLEENCKPDDVEEVFKDIIECIQQTAIWSITGKTIPANNINIYVSETNGATQGTSIENKYFKNGDLVNNPLRKLYNYLTSKPKENTSYSYGKEESTFNFDKSNVKVSCSDSGVKIGPYTITASNYSEFTAKITKGGTELEKDKDNVKIVGDDDTEFEGGDIQEQISKSIGNNFYIQLPAGTSGNIKIEVSAKTHGRKIELWTTGDNTLQQSQPVVIIEETTNQHNADNEQTVNPQNTKITVTKKWVDNSNQDGKERKITVKLTATNDPDFAEQTKTLESPSWKCTFDNLPIYSSDGTKRQYHIEEVDAPEGYTVTYEQKETGEVIITNTLNPDKVSIDVQKKWENGSGESGSEGNGSEQGSLPTIKSVEVQLYKNGKPMEGKRLTLSAETDWKGSFDGLDKYENKGDEIHYSVRELTELDGWSSSVTGSMDKGFVITNTYNSTTTQVSVRKEWVDSNNKSLRPESITVELYDKDTR